MLYLGMLVNPLLCESEAGVTEAREVVKEVARYETLGLVANPFAAALDPVEPGVQAEIAGEGNLLLAAIRRMSKETSPKPLWVEKEPDLPSSYALVAMAHAESIMAIDDTLNILYAYVQLYTLKVGTVRATLGVLSERLTFRELDRTLVPYLESILADPDTALASYQVLGPDGLEAFAVQFRQDPLKAVHDLFGEETIERRPELASVSDLRQLDMDEDVVDEDDATNEIDSTVGDAPGTTGLLTESADERAAEAESDVQAEDLTPVLDYIIEHTKAHLSPVIARGLRVYHDRGLAATAAEFKITKAPRKTLAAIIRFARYRYDKIVLFYDSFEDWMNIEPDLRSKLVGAFSEIRWKVAGDAFVVFMVERGAAPELEESFGSAERIVWDFPDIAVLQQEGDSIDADSVNRWLQWATAPGATPMTLQDPVLAELLEAADGSIARFASMAFEAIENAADRRAAALDAAARDAAMAVQH